MMPARRIFLEKRHLLWPIVVLAAVNALLFGLVTRPLGLKVANGEQIAEASRAALMVARRDFAAAKATVTGKTQADAELRKFYGEVLPPDVSGARRITYLRIEQLASQSNLRLDRETSSRKVQRDSDLVKFTYTAQLEGEYRDIRRFIHALETAPEFLVLENVELTQSESQSRGIDVAVQIATYYRVDANGN